MFWNSNLALMFKKFAKMNVFCIKTAKIVSSVELCRTRVFTQKTSETPLIFRYYSLFSKEYELKNNSIKSRLGSLSSGCILARALSFCYKEHENICVRHFEDF